MSSRWLEQHLCKAGNVTHMAHVNAGCTWSPANEDVITTAVEQHPWRSSWDYHMWIGTIHTKGPQDIVWWSILSISLLLECTSVFRQSSLWMQFCEWLWHQHTVDKILLHNILWTDEACLHVRWCSISTTATSGHAIILMLSANAGIKSASVLSVWTATLGDIVMGPCTLPDSLTAQWDRDFLEIVLHELPVCKAEVVVSVC
jgi:hypothetical protein